MKSLNYQAFYRPTTRFNRILDDTFSRYGPLHQIEETHLLKWQENSYVTFKSRFGNDKILDKVVNDTFWSLSNDKPPLNTWFAEAKFDGEQKPQIIIYQDSITTRLPSTFLFNLGGQSGTDHIFGHLYAFYSGQNDYGEEVACNYQFYAAKERGGIIWDSTTYL